MGSAVFPPPRWPCGTLPPHSPWERADNLSPCSATPATSSADQKFLRDTPQKYRPMLRLHYRYEDRCLGGLYSDRSWEDVRAVLRWQWSNPLSVRFPDAGRAGHPLSWGA